MNAITMNWAPDRWLRREGGRVSALGRLAVPLLLSAGLANAADVEVTLDDTRGACRVHGSFIVPVSSSVAWDVLSDYDGIGQFVRSVRASRMERQSDGRLLLRQDAVGGVFVFRRRMQVLLEIDEEPRNHIGFRDVLGKDFRRYVGEWRIADHGKGAQVVYELEAEPRAAIARALCRGSLLNAARDLLTQVRVEMIRRGVSEHAKPEKPVARDSAPP